MKKRQRSSRQPPFLSENKSQPWPFLVSAGFLVLCCCVLSSAFASVAVFYSLFAYYLIIKLIPSSANYYTNFAKIFLFRKCPLTPCLSSPPSLLIHFAHYFLPVIFPKKRPTRLGWVKIFRLVVLSIRRLEPAAACQVRWWSRRCVPLARQCLLRSPGSRPSSSFPVVLACGQLRVQCVQMALFCSFFQKQVTFPTLYLLFPKKVSAKATLPKVP